MVETIKQRDMKKFLLLSALWIALPLGMMAQDDLYFTPSKSVEKPRSSYEPMRESEASYSGSNRDVDEYNRRGRYGSYFKKIGTDSLGNDVIEFHTGMENVTDTLHVYPGTSIQYTGEDDYACSRRMSRFDDYYLYDPLLYSWRGFGPYWRMRYYDWYDPWYYGGYYGNYYGWYDPWFYGYRPWSGWYGWYTPSYYVSYGGKVTGTSNHGTVNNPGRFSSENSRFSGFRGNGQLSGNSRGGQFTRPADRTANGNAGKFGGSRRPVYENNNSRTVTPPRSYGNSTPTYSSGSFGGSRGGGNSGGGNHSGGSRGGGGNFGGRR